MAKSEKASDEDSEANQLQVGDIVISSKKSGLRKLRREVVGLLREKTIKEYLFQTQQKKLSSMYG